VYLPVKSEGSQPLPVGVYFHGGGWCCGDLDTEDPFCQLVAEHLPCVIVSVEYRLAPEYKSPTQLEDAREGWNWVKSNFKTYADHANRFQAFRNASKLNGDIQKYFVIGQSAGGHLALALANKLVNLNRQGEVRGIAALVPIAAHPDHIPAEYVDKYRSFRDCANAPMNSARTMIEFFGLCSFYEHV
jgi:versiconal hemiacetal acetate esterase